MAADCLKAKKCKMANILATKTKDEHTYPVKQKNKTKQNKQKKKQQQQQKINNAFQDLLPQCIIPGRMF